MKLIKLTALPLALFAMLALSSCEPDAELKKTTDYSKTGIALTGAQVSPVVSPSAALGTMDVSYSKETRILTYNINWTGLAGNVTAMHLHGLAPTGYASSAAAVQNIIASSNGIFAPGASYGVNGKLTATLLVDGVLVKEADLLNGMYYIDIHTSAYPTDPRGEIRGQIRFQ